jgi:hypothetical protein
MTEQEMQDALLKLAFEMTASMDTANMCIIDMDLEDSDQLYDVAQYLKKLAEGSLAYDDTNPTDWGE